MILEKLNLQHEHSLSHKNSLPGSNPLIPLGPCALHIQSLSLLPCLSNPFIAVSPLEDNKQTAAFIAFFSQCELLFVTKEFITCAFPVKKLPHTGKESNITFTCRQVTPLPATISANSLSQIVESVTYKSALPALQVMKTFLLRPPH